MMEMKDYRASKRTRVGPEGYKMTITPQPWIPVEERLPEEDRPVLVWNSGGDCPKPWAWWQICDYKDGKWREQDERDEYPGVTHWMPLPPEPLNWKPIFDHPEPPEVK